MQKLSSDKLIKEYCRLSGKWILHISLLEEQFSIEKIQDNIKYMSNDHASALCYEGELVLSFNTKEECNECFEQFNTQCIYMHICDPKLGIVQEN